MQGAHRVATKPASASLVGLGGIGETITEHDTTRRQAGLNYFGNVLRTRREHQRHFSASIESGGPGIEQHFADLLSRRGAPRLARDQHRQSTRAQSPCELLKLRALAGSVKAFERDEFSTARHAAE